MTIEEFHTLLTSLYSIDGRSALEFKLTFNKCNSYWKRKGFSKFLYYLTACQCYDTNYRLL